MTMAFSANGPGQDITGINVTPLVDITLVLLIVFMVTAKLVMSQALPLDLPKAESAGAVSTVLMVSVGERGELRVHGSPLAGPSALRALAARARAQTPDLRAVIAASRKTAHGEVMTVLDALREAGLVKVAFAAEKAP
jgi:biopolymer transport protein ExbD